MGGLHKILREPFVHFLALGLLIFLWHGLRGDERSPMPQTAPAREITITRDQINQLKVQWQKAWNRNPTKQELDGLIADHLKEEIYYREALKLGLDRDDLVVRRRLRAKMEFLASAALENVRPDETILRQWFEKNHQRYVSETLLSFDQIYLGAGDGSDVPKLARRYLAQLKSGVSPTRLGVPSPLPVIFENRPASEITRQLGPDGFAAISAAPIGQWTGPLRSGVGLHLILLRKLQPASPALFEDQRSQIENDWRAETLAAREAAGFNELEKSYVIRIEE
jgi:hypothetical protein